MGSGSWFKTIIRGKKVKVDKLKQSKGSSASEKPTESKSNGGLNTSRADFAHIKLSEDIAATRIQTAFRAYSARKALRCMKGAIRFQKLTQEESIRKQSTSTLAHLQAWSRIQAQIRDRRQCMVTEGRLKQKKLENQLKLEAKIHGLEVEWNGGCDTMEEILARLQQREEAALKRERGLAYAFTHQWRVNSGQNHQGSNGSSEVGKSNWGWSWKERWIAARPWENRVASNPISPNKAIETKPSKGTKSYKSMTTQKSVPVKKSGLVNGKMSVKSRRLSFPGAEKPGEKFAKAKEQEAVVKKRDSVS